MKSLHESQTWRTALATFAHNMSTDIVPSGKILITGATGLIGSALVDLLLAVRNQHGRPCSVVAAGRSLARLQQRFDSPDGLELLEYDATAPFTPGLAFSTIIHAASNASPELYLQDPCGTLDANISGLRNILEHARQNTSCRIIYISSSEVYGRRQQSGPANERDYGFIDPLNPRSSYAVAKRAAEAYCVAYATQHNSHVVIARPGHVYGPTATTSDRRVSSDFAFRSARGEPLVLKSDGSQIRSYCHCLDCATAILTILAHGTPATAYNISNPDSVISIRTMASLLAKAGGVSITIGTPTNAERAAFNPIQDSSLDADRLLSLGWRGTLTAHDGLSQTVQVLKEIL